MKTRPRDLRTPAQRVRDTASIVGSLVHEGYVPNVEDEFIHQQSLRGEISTEEAIALFRKRGLETECETLARSLKTER
jgi:hypothetical protein